MDSKQVRMRSDLSSGKIPVRFMESGKRWLWGEGQMPGTSGRHQVLRVERGDQGTKLGSSWTGHLCWPTQAVSGGMTGRPMDQKWAAVGSMPRPGRPTRQRGTNLEIRYWGRDQVADAAGPASQGAGGFQQL